MHCEQFSPFQPSSHLQFKNEYSYYRILRQSDIVTITYLTVLAYVYATKKCSYSVTNQLLFHCCDSPKVSQYPIVTLFKIPKFIAKTYCASKFPKEYKQVNYLSKTNSLLTCNALHCIHHERSYTTHHLGLTPVLASCQQLLHSR